MLGSVGAHAECHQINLSETESVLVDAARRRFSNFGVTDISFAAPVDQGRLFQLSGVNPSMALIFDGPEIREVQIVVSKDSDSDRDLVARMSAFVASRFSGQPEPETTEAFLSAFRQLPRPGDKLVKFANHIIGIVSNLDGGIIMMVGKIACD